MPDRSSPLWPTRTEIFFRDRQFEPQRQEGPTCVATVLGMLTGQEAGVFVGRVNTQDPRAWSAALAPSGLRLACGPPAPAPDPGPGLGPGPAVRGAPLRGETHQTHLPGGTGGGWEGALSREQGFNTPLYVGKLTMPIVGVYISPCPAPSNPLPAPRSTP
jgi:hypothetical protein